MAPAIAAQGEAVGEVAFDPLVEVHWYANCGFGCDIPAGTKLYTAPTPAPARVTEEMVGRALLEWERLYGHQIDKVRMRAALTAALGGDHG